MAPINFENNIKDKLDKRQLKPSADAWSKLSDRLDEDDEKINRKSYWWLGIAASVIGILFTVSQLLNNETKVNDAPKIVDTPEVIQQKATNSVAVDNNTLINNTEEINIKSEKESIIKVEAQKLIITKNKQQLVAAVNQQKIVSKDKNSETATIYVVTKEVTFEEQKIQDVIAQVQTMEDDNKVITDSDIDDLLEDAQKDIKRNRLHNETSGQVSAHALLQDVEAELDQSFREKVFDAIKSSYSSVKTAVAQRND